MNHHTHFQQTQHFPYSYKKKIDAFVSADNIVSSYTGVFPVEKLGKEPYYLAVAKGHKNLLNELNMSLSVIDGQDGLFLNELKNKYSSDTGVGMNETTVTIILPFTIANAQKNSSAHGNGNADHLNNDEFTPSISDEDIALRLFLVNRFYSLRRN